MTKDTQEKKNVEIILVGCLVLCKIVKKYKNMWLTCNYFAKAQYIKMG